MGVHDIFARSEGWLAGRQFENLKNSAEAGADINVIVGEEAGKMICKIIPTGGFTVGQAAAEMPCQGCLSEILYFVRRRCIIVCG